MMFTETELANLRTACMTSRMRSDVESCATLDTLAMKLFDLRGEAMRWSDQVAPTTCARETANTLYKSSLEQIARFLEQSAGMDGVCLSPREKQTMQQTAAGLRELLSWQGAA